MLLMDECVIKMFGLVSAVALQFRVGDGLCPTKQFKDGRFVAAVVSAGCGNEAMDSVLGFNLWYQV